MVPATRNNATAPITRAPSGPGCSARSDAHLKVYGDKAKTRALLDTLLTHGPDRYGVGSLAEIYDAEPPFAPNGCIAQAWSVAEILRVLALLG